MKLSFNQNIILLPVYFLGLYIVVYIILLVKETLDTVFRDYPQGEKDLLLNKLDKAMNENIDSSYEERQYGIESEFKQEEEERRNQLELELKQE